MTTATMRKWLDGAPYGDDDGEWMWLPRCDYPSADDACAALYWMVGPMDGLWEDEEAKRVRLGWVVLRPDVRECNEVWALEVPRGAPHAIEGWVVESW